MAKARVELVLTTTNEEERALIGTLDALSEEYGAKGRFMLTRLLAGYSALMREVAGIQAETDPMAALDKLVETVNNGLSRDHYRVLRALLTSSPSAQPAAAARKVEVPTAPVAAPIPGYVASPPAEVAAPAPTIIEATQAPVEPTAAQSVVGNVSNSVCQSVLPNVNVVQSVGEIVSEAVVETLLQSVVESVESTAPPTQAPSAWQSAPEPVDVGLPDDSASSPEAVNSPPVAQEQVGGAAAVQVPESPVTPTPAPLQVNWAAFKNMAGHRGD